MSSHGNSSVLIKEVIQVDSMLLPAKELRVRRIEYKSLLYSHMVDDTGTGRYMKRSPQQVHCSESLPREDMYSNVSAGKLRNTKNALLRTEEMYNAKLLLLMTKNEHDKW